MPDEAQVPECVKKMPTYVGTKVICAIPLDEEEFRKQRKQLPPVADDLNRPGYLVVYPDGYESWSPKDVFEVAYRLVSDDERRMI